MADRASRAPIAVLCGILVVSAAAAAAAWGSGSLTATPTAVTTPIVTSNLPGTDPLGSTLAAWCSIDPGDRQYALLAAMGPPIRQGAAVSGQELWLNVTPPPLFVFKEAMVPMHRSEGFAVWRRGSYLLADTYAPSGSIARMDAWPVEVAAKGALRCPLERGAPFGLVTVPYVVGHTFSAAASMLHAANLAASIPSISTAQMRSVTVATQVPSAGRPIAAGTTVRLTPAAATLASDRYPIAACDSSDPTALLLPVTAMPDMRLGFAPIADGGGSLTPMAIVLPGAHGMPLSSAATISEHLRDRGAPWSAIQNASPFNVAHPRAITTSDEALTGFTEQRAEADFFARAPPQEPPPEDDVAGRLVSDRVANDVDVAWLPRPNEIVTYSQPGSDVPTTIDVSVESGRTVLGLDVEGGVALTVRDVMPYVLEAIHQVAARCGSLEIMSAR